MHIIVVALGSVGDVHPLLGLSRTFARHGHKVTFCANSIFADAAERCGLRHLPMGTVEEYYADINNPAMWNPRSSLKELWQPLSTRIRPMYDLLLKEIDEDTVIAAHPWAIGARLLQEQYGVPLVTLNVSPAIFFSAKKPPVLKQLPVPGYMPYPVRAALLWAFERGVLDRVCGPDINGLRAELGLPPVKRIMCRWLSSPQGVLALFPAWFAEPQSDWPPNVTLAGFPLFDEADFREIDPELQEFLASGEKPVVFTLGSTLADGFSYYSAAAEALQELGLRGVFIARAETVLPKFPPSILVRSYIPLSKLLPHVRALVHHGGIGTASQAFVAGIPQLVKPHAMDQFDNASNIERLGCGFELKEEKGFDIYPSLKRLLESETIQQNCITVQSRMVSGETAGLKALSVIEAVAKSAVRKLPAELTLTNQ
ncbi:glycosyltransferase [Granulicella arctica]|uniref:Rhamnosyltransferase subunit B n=1 Tax=Granulicella arctica TaxID=940613 RepID=A0A7Y9PGR1_9BACT|nr:nucleotide disphospho-sugar-binding domain-containing protein [Granulicella arctica]NYF79595.1 rhamnosyltransferase subunit B [Granulicella arctica]